jgi:hypothetical protein
MLRPSNAGMEKPISVNYENSTWSEIFYDLCSMHSLRCAVSKGVIYVAPIEYLNNPLSGCDCE